MKTFVRCLPLGLALACCAPVSGQFQVADTMNRAARSSAVHSDGSLPIGYREVEFLVWNRRGNLKINL